MVFKNKNFFYVLLVFIVAVLAGVFILYKYNDFNFEQDLMSVEGFLSRVKPAHVGFQFFEDKSLGISFYYPQKLQIIPKPESVELDHSVPFKNYGDCDMKGDSKTYNNLTDFHASFQIINKNVADSVKLISPYVPSENFSGGTLKVSPGFIDSYQIGNFTGFAIYEGVEGCGHTIYYFPLDNNTRTFVATKNMVQQLSGIMSSNIKEELLKVPGVINNEESKSIFENILESVKFTKVESIVGGDKDEHGCIGSAGYSWCEAKNKCLRVWEEKCK